MWASYPRSTGRSHLAGRAAQTPLNLRLAKDYGTMTRLLKEHSGSGAKIIFGLEGGYQLKANVPGGNLADAVVETIKALD